MVLHQRQHCWLIASPKKLTVCRNHSLVGIENAVNINLELCSQFIIKKQKEQQWNIPLIYIYIIMYIISCLNDKKRLYTCKTHTYPLNVMVFFITYPSHFFEVLSRCIRCIPSPPNMFQVIRDVHVGNVFHHGFAHRHHQLQRLPGPRLKWGDTDTGPMGTMDF